MNRKQHLSPLPVVMLAGALLAVGLAGCQTEPITGRKQFIFTSAAEETKLGLQSWQEVQKAEKPSTDAAKIAAVQRVGHALQAAIDTAPRDVIPKQEFQWEFRVFASATANAFCLPGGKVAVYEGLFQYVANDAELAAVVGHEIAHAIARHGGERMSEAAAVNLGAVAVGAAVSSKAAEEQQRWLMAYAGVSTVGFTLPFSRTHEYSADSMGLVIMGMAGYEPQAAIDFWKKFAGKDTKSLGSIGALLSTHPVGASRIQKLQECMPRATLEYQKAPTRRGYGQKLP